MKSFLLYILATFLVYSSIVFSKPVNWGHLLTGTTQNLTEKEVTVGLHLLSYGISDQVSLGISPWAYSSYDFNNFFMRYSFYNKSEVTQAIDFIFLDSRSGITDSYFDQTSYWGKYNIGIKHKSKNQSYLSLGFQYYTKDNSPHSLRGDPQGKHKTLGIKGDESYFYEDKLADYKNDKRDPKTISLSYLYVAYLNNTLSLNFELGALGINYDYPFNHFGLSLIYATDKHLVAYGWSRSYRMTPYIGDEAVYHPEIKYQFTF